MKKIVISMLIVTGFSTIKGEVASTKDTDLGAPSKTVVVFLRAAGIGSNRISVWVDALRKCSAHVGVNIKTYMASERNSRVIMVGADAIAIRKAVENNTQPIEGDIVMAHFVMEGDADSVSVHSDIHTVEVIQAADEKGWQALKTKMPDATSGSYVERDSCTKCVYKWKAVVEQEKLRVLYHKEGSCKSDFAKELFFAAITEQQA